MKKLAGVVCTALLAMGLYAAPAMAADVTVSLPSFPVTLNGVTMEQSKSQYPMLVYKDITYVPMTWEDTRLLGLESAWTQKGGLVVSKAANVQDQKTAQSVYKPYKTATANGGSYKAVTAGGKITVNGKNITNSSEQYPLLVFRDVTYFPLTWRFAVTEFGWDYSFDSKKGLVIVPKATGSGSSASTAVNTKGEIIGQKIAVTGSSVNLRSDAGTSSKTVGTAQKGDEFIVLSTKTVDGKVWYQVMPTSGGDKVWLASWYTSQTSGNSTSANATATAPATTPSTAPATQTSGSTAANSMVGKTVQVTGTTVNLRADTSTSSAVLGQTVKGDTYTVLAAKTVGSDTWYQVTTKTGAKAWIAGWLVAEKKPAANSTPTVGTSANTTANTATSSSASSMVGKQVSVNTAGVNLRAEPSTTAKIAGTTSKGVQYTVLAEKTVGSEVWYQVQSINGDKVWIASWLVDKVTTGSGASISAPATALSLQSVQQQGSKTIITIRHGNGNKYSTTKSTATQLALKLSNVTLGNSIQKTYSSGPLRELQIAADTNTTANVTLTLQSGAYCTVKESGDNLVITAYNQHDAGESGLRGKVIVIDPGHGGSDPGAIGKVLGVTDADLGLTIGQKLRTLLQAQGATVIMTRDSDIRVGLSDRPAMSNKAEADLFISIHGNSAENTSAKGIQVYYYAPDTNANLMAQRFIRNKLATEVSKSLQAATGSTSSVRTANYAVLRENDRPSILVEVGFVSNAEEEALLAEDSYRQKLANGIYQGVLNYLNQY